MINVLYAMLVFMVTQAVIKTMITLGLAFGTYTVLSDWIDNALDMMNASFQGMGQVGVLLQIAGIGEALSIIGSAASAVAAVMAVKTFLVKS